jgi:hypothetical protein
MNNNINPFLNNNPNRKVRSKAVNTVPLTYFNTFKDNVQRVVKSQQRRISTLTNLLGNLAYNNNEGLEDIYRLSMENSYLKNQLYGYNYPGFFIVMGVYFLFLELFLFFWNFFLFYEKKSSKTERRTAFCSRKCFKENCKTKNSSFN